MNNIVYKPTGQVFTSRKEAKEALGHYNYNRALKDRQFSFLLCD